MPIYILGVIDSSSWVEFGPIGFTDAYGEKIPVKTVPYGTISAVVCEMDEWKVNEGNKVDLLNKLLEHQKILEKIMQKQFILPVKFGTTVEGNQDVVTIMSRYCEQLKRELGEMKDFIEIDVVATWDTAAQVKRVAQGDKEVMLLKATAEKLPPDKRGEKIIEVGMLLEGKLEGHRKKVEREISQTLKEYCLDVVNHDRLEDRMVINSSFLLKKDDEARFFEAIDKLDQKIDGTIRFKCISPLPPHSFKTIVIHRIDVQELREAMNFFDVTAKTTIEKLNEKNRRLIKEMHPDKSHSAAANAEFDKLNKSYKLLSGVLRCGGNFSSCLEARGSFYVLGFQGGEK